MSSQDDFYQDYPIAAWLDDFDQWVSRGPLTPSDVPQVMAYFWKKYPQNKRVSEISARFLNSLQLLESLIPQLRETNLVINEPDGGISFPTAFQVAFYQATFCFPEVMWKTRIDVPFLSAQTKALKDWNEDRT